MKTKALFTSLLVVACAITSQAQGYMDGIEFYKIGQLDNAKELLERNLNNASTDKAEAYYYLGQVAMHQTDDDGNTKPDLAKAKEYFDKGVTANPKNPFNYVGLGAVALKQGNKGAASDAFKLAEKNAKKNSAVAIEMARAYYFADATAYHKDIEKLKNNAFKWNQNDPNYYIFRGDEYADEEEWGKSAAQYETALLKDIDNVEAYVKFANTYFYVDRRLAINKLEELYQKQPNSALVQRQLAEKYYEDNRGSKAAEYYGLYYNNPNHFVQDEIRYAQLLIGSQEYDKCIDVCKKIDAAVDRGTSNHFFANRMTLYALVAKKDWNAAVAQGEKFFALPESAATPYQANDYIYYAEALKAVGRSAEAVTAYEKAIKINPKNVDLLRGLSESYAAEKDFAASAKYQQMVYDSGEGNANDIFDLAVCYYNLASTSADATTKTDALAKSEKYIQEVNSKVPDNVQIVNQIANIEKLKEGDKNTGAAMSAYNHLLQIIEAKADKSGYDAYYRRAYNYMATYYMTNGQKELAKDYYRKWLQYDSENEALRKYVDSLK